MTIRDKTRLVERGLVQYKGQSKGFCAGTAGDRMWIGVMVLGQLRFSQNTNQQIDFIALWEFF